MHEDLAARRCRIARWATALTAAAMATVTPAADQDPWALDAIVVTGTRSPKPLLDAPVRTEVVTRAEIQRRHATSLTEALRTVPGLLIQPTHGKSGHEVWMQGLSGDRVLILLDGQPLAARTGSTVDLSQIALADVARIEITRGAVSALYGSSAMGGVVNVITREAPQRTRYSLQATAGSYGDKDRDRTPSTGELAASVGGGWDGGALRLTGDWQESTGYRLDPDRYTAEGYAGSRANAAATLGLDLGAGTRLRLRPDYYHEDLSRPYLAQVAGRGQVPHRKDERVRRWHLPARLSAPLGESFLQLSGLYERYAEQTAQDVTGTPATDQRREAFITHRRGELQWDRPLGTAHYLTAGLLAFRDTLEQDQFRVEGDRVRRSTEVEDARRSALEAYLQDDIRLAPRWELVPGLRYGRDSDYGDFLTPKVNLFHQRVGHRGLTTNLRLGLGRGYRAPNLKERYYAFDHSALGYVVLGNPELEPERSTSLQLGMELVAAGRWRLDANLFYNRLTDLITTAFDAAATTPEGPAVYRYQNIERATTRGVELSASRQVGSWLQLELAYTHLRARDEDTGNTLPQRPRHQGQLGVQWRPAPWASAGLDASYRGSEYVDTDNTIRSPAWTRWDLRLNAELQEGLTAFAGIENLTDVHRSPGDPHDQRPDAGRFGYVGLRYSQ